MQHKLRVIGSDGSLKIPERLFGSIRSLLAQGKDTINLQLATAGWINATRPDHLDGQIYGTTDPNAGKLALSWSSSTNSQDRVRSALSLVGGADLTDSTNFLSGVASCLDEFSKGKVRL
jgi:fructuronate reductase